MLLGRHPGWSDRRQSRLNLILRTLTTSPIAFSSRLEADFGVMTSAVSFLLPRRSLYRAYRRVQKTPFSVLRLA